MPSKLFKPRTFTAEEMAERVAAAGYIDGLHRRLDALEVTVAKWQASERAVSASALIALGERLERLEGPVRAYLDHLTASKEPG